MSERVVIFVYSASEAQWAVDYTCLHPQQTVKILPASISAHLVILKNSLEPSSYSFIYRQHRDYYNSQITTFRRQSVRLFKRIKNKLTGFNILGINQIEVLRLLFEAEFLDVIYAYYLYQTIQKEWDPDKFMFSRSLKTSLSGWEPAYFSAAALIADFFCPRQKKYYYDLPHEHRIPSQFDFLLNSLKSPKSIIDMVKIVIWRWWEKGKTDVPGSPADFLFFSGGANLDYYSNVFSGFNQFKPNPKYVITTDKQSLADELKLRKKKINFTPLENYAHTKMFKMQKDETNKIIAKIDNLYHDKQIFANLFPKNIPLTYRLALMFKLKLVITTYGKKFIGKLLLADAAIKSIKPRLVITTHDPAPSAMPFVLLAKNAGIKTLALQHGFHNLEIGADYKSDNIAVWSDFFAERFRKKLHRDGKTIFKTGFPYLDDVFKRTQYLKTQTGKNIPKFHQPIRLGILFTLFQIDSFSTPKFLYDTFTAIAREKMQVEIWIRTHPGQNIKDVIDLANYYKIVCRYNHVATLDEFILQTDVICSWDTTAILWAMIYGKPLFHTTPWWGEGYYPTQKYKAAWMLSSADDFIIKLQRLIADPQRIHAIIPGQKRFLKQVLGVTDGTASYKLSQLIHNLVRQHQIPEV